MQFRYALLQPVDFTLDEATALIGRLAEIDRQLTGFDAATAQRLRLPL